MRQNNLNEVASSVVKGMDRSLGRSVQPTEEMTREGSRKGVTIVDGKSPLKYLMMLEYLQGFPEEREIIESGDEDAAEEYLRKDAEINGQTYEESVRSIEEEYSDDDNYLGGRKGSRKGEVYDWDCIDYEAIAGELEKLGEDPWGLDFDEIYDLAESKGLTPDMFTREC